MQPKQEVRMPGVNEKASELVNRWLKATQGLPATLSLTKLGFAIVAELESAYSEGFEAAEKVHEDNHGNE